MIDPESWKHISQVVKPLKYVLAGATTILTVVNLRYRTTLEADSRNRKVLTFEGKLYQAGLIIVATLTFGATIIGDRADANVAADERAMAQLKSDQHLDAALEQQAKTKISPLMDPIKDAVAKTSQQIQQKLTEQVRSAKELSSLQQGLVRDFQQSSENLGALNRAIVDSQNMTRQLSEQQQNLAEGSRLVKSVILNVYVPPDGIPQSQMDSWRVQAAHGPTPYAYAIVHMLAPLRPGFYSSLEMSFGIAKVSLMENACSIPMPESEGEYCMLAVGLITGSSSFEVAVARPIVDARPWEIDLTSAFRNATGEHLPQLLARDMIFSGAYISTCPEIPSPHRDDPANILKPLLIDVTKNLPSKILINLLENQVDPADPTRTDSISHRVTLVRDASQEVSGGCLTTKYSRKWL